MKKISVDLSERSYPFFIGENITDRIPVFIRKNGLPANIFCIADSNVIKLHEKKINRMLKNVKGNKYIYILKHGESSKSLTEQSKIYSTLLKNGFIKDTVIFAIGGGVTGDTSGFAASTFMRGIPLIHIPTTLVASVDSSIGGKTAVNFNGYKNIVGTFYQPEAVFCDLDFLQTLPEKEIRSGLGEVVKYSFISNNDFFVFTLNHLDKITNLNTAYLEQAIIKSVFIKAAVVTRDERESGLRKILNFGHTFAHAIESCSQYRVKHGEAVIAGIIAAIYLSNKSGLLNDKRIEEYLSLPKMIKVSRVIKQSDNESIINAMLKDKKNRNSKINFVLISRIGKVLIDVKTSIQDIEYSLDKMKETIRT